MLQGKELAAALQVAISLKRKREGFEDLGPSKLARAFGVTQPSASGWLVDGRIAKKHLGTLLEFFSDVVGPEHWGLPFSKNEFLAVLAFRQLPARAQVDVLRRMQEAASIAQQAAAGIGDDLIPASRTGKRKPRAA
jgi:hypothetical protein